MAPEQKLQTSEFERLAINFIFSIYGTPYYCSMIKVRYITVSAIKQQQQQQQQQQQKKKKKKKKNVVLHHSNQLFHTGLWYIKRIFGCLNSERLV